MYLNTKHILQLQKFEGKTIFQFLETINFLQILTAVCQEL